MITVVSGLTLQSRAWQQRRMIVGSDVMYFTFLDDDYVVDCIPLAEIIQLKKLGPEGKYEAHLAGSESTNLSAFDLEGLSSDRILRIDTNPDGYNSGRTYYLQIDSDGEFSRLAINLTEYVKIAKKRLEAKTVLERSKKKVREVFHSSAFQCGASFCILAVSYRHVLKCVVLLV